MRAAERKETKTQNGFEERGTSRERDRQTDKKKHNAFEEKGTSRDRQTDKKKDNAFEERGYVDRDTWNGVGVGGGILNLA